MARHIVANLYAEEEHRNHECAVPARPLKKPARQALAVAGALARVVAHPTDTLWLEGELDAARIDAPARFRPHAIATGRPRSPRGADDWYWMEPPRDGGATPWARREWAASLAPECDAHFPIRVVRSPREFEAAAREAIDHSGLGRWIVKTQYSAAGRERWTGTEPTLSPEVNTALETEGAVIVEPWVERIADFGLCGTTDDSVPYPVHELVNDGDGRFRGVRLRLGSASVATLHRDESDSLAATFARVRDRLRADGYRGPFGIDAFRYRGRDGAERFRTLVEVNPRHSMGSLARRWVDALAADELRGWDAVEMVISRKRSAPNGAVVVVSPAASDPTSVWFEPQSTSGAPRAAE